MPQRVARGGIGRARLVRQGRGSDSPAGMPRGRNGASYWDIAGSWRNAAGRVAKPPNTHSIITIAVCVYCTACLSTRLQLQDF